MEPARRFEDLVVWQEAHALVLGLYRVTRQLPADEKFGLVPQVRRAAVSVPANIVEGFRRRGPAAEKVGRLPGAYVRGISTRVGAARSPLPAPRSLP